MNVITMFNPRKSVSSCSELELYKISHCQHMVSIFSKITICNYKCLFLLYLFPFREYAVIYSLIVVSQRKPIITYHYDHIKLLRWNGRAHKWLPLMLYTVIWQTIMITSSIMGEIKSYLDGSIGTQMEGLVVGINSEGDLVVDRGAHYLVM